MRSTLDVEQRLGNDARPHRFRIIDCHLVYNASMHVQRSDQNEAVGEAEISLMGPSLHLERVLSRDVLELMIRPARKTFCETLPSSITWFQPLNTVWPRKMNETNQCCTFLLALLLFSAIPLTIGLL